MAPGASIRFEVEVIEPMGSEAVLHVRGAGGIRRGLGRGLVGAGAALALLGGFRLASAPIPIGDPIPILPVAALVAGAVLFAVGARLSGLDWNRAAPPEPTGWPAPVIPRAARPRVGAAVVVGLAVVLLYATLGYHPLLFVGWVGSLGLATWGLWPARRREGSGRPLEPWEIAFLGLVLLASSALVLPYLGVLPYEISTDEVYSVRAVRRFADGTTTNAFGLVSWWGLPALWFAGVASITPVTGTSIEAVRLVTALTALLVPLPFYVWVRTLHGRTVATVATALLAFAHAFIGWGRIALNQNSPVLLLVVALALLAVGLRNRCPVRVLWGGVALGLGFYTYPSGQVSIVIWLAALAAWWVAGRLPRRALAPAAALGLLGFALCVAPMLVNALLDFGGFAERARAVAITNPRAVEYLGGLWGLTDAGEIVRENLKRALLGFNAPYPYVTYYNPVRPLLDPVSGSLVWLGLGLAATRLRRRGMALAAIGFVLVYAAGFATEGAPVHGRLLIAFPFVAVLAAEALVGLVGALAPEGSRRRPLRPWALALAVVAIAIGNLVAFRGFVRHQMTAGRNDAVTAIGRTLDVGIGFEGPLRRYFGQGKSWDRRHRVFFHSEEGAPLFRWAEERDWHAWISFFADSAFVHRVEDLDEFLPGGTDDLDYGYWTRATLFLPTRAWERGEARLRERFPHLEHRTITPNRRVSMVEIRR